jgi:hypothetical protein
VKLNGSAPRLVIANSMINCGPRTVTLNSARKACGQMMRLASESRNWKRADPAFTLINSQA